MSIAHRLVSNTILHFPDKSHELLAEYFNNEGTVKDDKFEIAWNKALVYDQAFINQKGNSNHKQKTVIQNEDVFAENFIKFLYEGSSELRSNIDSMYNTIQDINNYSKETNEKYIVKELTSKLMKSLEAAKSLKSLDTYVSSSMYAQRFSNDDAQIENSSASNNKQNSFDYSYLYLFRDSLAKAHFVFDHPHIRRNLSTSAEYAPLAMARYTVKPHLVDVHFGKITPQTSHTAAAAGSDAYRDNAPAKSSSTANLVQERYRQDIHVYGDFISYVVPNNLKALHALAWSTHRTLTEATGTKLHLCIYLFIYFGV